MLHSPGSARSDLSRTVAFGAAMTCGVLAALAAYIVLADVGLDLASAWRTGHDGRAPLASALAWWLICGCGFVTSLVSVQVIRIGTSGSRFGHWLLRACAATFVCVLASVSHATVGPPGAPAAARAAVGLAALLAGGLMAMCGTRFALPQTSRASRGERPRAARQHIPAEPPRKSSTSAGVAEPKPATVGAE